MHYRRSELPRCRLSLYNYYQSRLATNPFVQRCYESRECYYRLVEGTVLLLSAAKATLTGNTIRATAAMRTFNLVTKMNPWGLLLGAITAVITALVLFSNKQKEVNVQLKMQNEAIKEANVQTAAQEHHLRQLLKTANDTNKSYNERKKAVDELNRLVPQYNKQLTVETANTLQAKKRIGYLHRKP